MNLHQLVKWCASIALTLLLLMILLINLLQSISRSSLRDLPQVQCSFKLSHIKLGLHNYHTQYGTLPPAIVTDENGRPMHSWRALISHFAQAGIYHLDEPWDGPRNIHLIHNDDPNTPHRCPTGRNKNPFCTNYVVILNSKSPFPGSQSVALNINEQGGQSRRQTILVVEIAKSDILWTEPRDLHYDHLTDAVGADPHQVSSRHDRLVNAIVHDNRDTNGGEKLQVINIPHGTSVETLRQMCLLP